MARPRDTIYHYTSLETALTILSNGEFWASRIQCMNDGSENRYLLKKISQYVKKLKSHDQYNAHGDFGAEYVKNLRAKLKQATWYSDYVISFSTERDDLSQWRAYGGSVGCALGFNRRWIRAEEGMVFGEEGDRYYPAGAWEKRKFIECNYSNSNHERILRQMEQSIDSFLGNPARNPSEEGDNPLIPNINAFLALRDHLQVMPSIKHPKFKNENEWRIVISRRDDKGADYRMRKSLFVPFVRFPLYQSEKRLHNEKGVRKPRNGCRLLNEILIGPNPHRKANWQLVFNMIQVNPYLTGTVVNPSEIPYRDW